MAFVEIRIVQYDIRIDELLDDHEPGWNEWVGWCAEFDGSCSVLVISQELIEIHEG